MTAADLLELDGIAARQESIRFDLLDAQNVVQGELAVVSDTPATINNNVERAVRRTLQNVLIPPRPLSETNSALAYGDDIDPVADRVRPVWLVGGEEFNLGIFLFGTADRAPMSWGTDRAATLVDQCVILDEELEQSVGYPVGTSLSTILTEQAAAVGIVSTSIEGTAKTNQQPVGWPAGGAKRLQIFSEVCAMAGFFPSYFDNDGALVCRSAPDGEPPADFTYGIGSGATGRVINGTVEESDDLLDAPNRYIVRDTGATNGSVVGVYDVVDSAPHSAAHRGRVVATTTDLQGLTDQAAANEAARARAAQDSSTYRWLSFTATPDPRHDTFDYVSFDGTIYREQAWTLTLAPGGDHKHELRRQYF